MRKAICLVGLLCCVLVSSLRAQQWQWAHSALCSTPFGGSEGWLIKTDLANNVFVAGFYYGDSICLGNNTFYNPVNAANNVQTYIVKYDSNGNQQWSHAGQHGYSRPIAITADHKGNCFVFGYFLTDSIRFDDQLLINAHYDHLHPDANASYYLLKYSEDGILLWAINSNNSFHPSGDYLKPGGIAVDVSGDIYISSTYNSDTFTIDGHQLINTATDSTTDIFLAKYNTSGSLLWAKSYGGLKDDHILDVASNGYRVFLTGYFKSGYISFDGNKLFNSSKKGFLTCLDLNGNVKWIRATGGKGITRCVSPDKRGNVYVAGGFRDTLTFDTYEIRKPNGGYFLTKFDSAGNMQTPKILEPVNPMAACCDVYSMTTDACNNAWITINQEPNTGTQLDASTVAYPPAGSVDPVVIVGYNTEGKLFDHISLTSAGGYNTGLSNSGITGDQSGNLLFTGDYRAVDPFVIGKDSLHLYNGQLTNMFVGKYKPITECSAGPPPVYPAIPIIIVYPNPSYGGNAILSYTGDLSTGATMTLRDIAGKMIRIYPLTQQLTPFSVADLPAGVYMCMVKVVGREMYTLRLVVTH